jgi:hypothetical protein
MPSSAVESASSAAHRRAAANLRGRWGVGGGNGVADDEIVLADLEGADGICVGPEISA